VLFYRHMAFQGHTHLKFRGVPSEYYYYYYYYYSYICDENILYTFICGNTLGRFDTLDGRSSGV